MPDPKYYSYDALGHKTSQTDGNGYTQTWTYSQVGRLLASTEERSLPGNPARYTVSTH